MGKRRKSSRGSSSNAPAPLQPMMMMPQMMMMMPQMMGGAQQHQPALDDQRGGSGSDSDSSSSHPPRNMYRKDDEALLTRSATCLAKLPKVRLQQAVESACRSLDATATANCSAEDLSRLLYVFTKLRPNIKCTSLRAKSYKTLMNAMTKAGERVGKAMQAAQVLERVMPRGELIPDVLKEVAASQGFEEAWLEEVFAPPKKRKLQQALVTETYNLTLTRCGNSHFFQMHASHIHQ